MDVRSGACVLVCGALAFGGVAQTGAVDDRGPLDSPEGVAEGLGGLVGSLAGVAPERREVQLTERAFLQINGLAWRAAHSADFTLGGSREFSAESLELDEPVFGPLGDLALRVNDKYLLRMRGYGLDQQGTSSARSAFTAGGLSVVPGDTIETDFEYLAVEVAAGYSFDPVFSDPSTDIEIRFDAFVGVRVTDIELELQEVGGGQFTGGDTFPAAFGGTTMYMDLPAGWAIEVEGDGMGGDGVVGFGIDARVSLAPHDLFRAEFGFRHVSAEFDTDSEITFDGWTAGLYVGAGLSF
ncbi:MAG: hypothetical protein AAGI30_06745 [Planctomycetota bacterium]